MLCISEINASDNTSSASNESTQLLLVCSKANCFCKPKFSNLCEITFAPKDSHIETVASVLPESTTIISSNVFNFSKHFEMICASL